MTLKSRLRRLRRANLVRQSDVAEQHGLPPGFGAVALAGRGSFAEVWQVRDRETGCLYALKRLQAQWRDNPAANRLLHTETQVGQAVRSPYVVRVVRSEPSGDSPYTILEWVDGVSLEQRLSGGQRLPVGQAVWIARQCALGLTALEQAGYSHGDVKPANIFLTAGGPVKLIDLGFARAAEGSRTRSRDNPMMGTPEYLAPETLSRAPANPVTGDMYSLGVTLFRMLTGRLPFAAEAPAEILRHQRQSKPPLLRRWCPEAPRELAGLVNRLLAKQPIRRPRSLSALVEELIRLELMTLGDRFQAS